MSSNSYSSPGAVGDNGLSRNSEHTYAGWIYALVLQLIASGRPSSANENTKSSPLLLADGVLGSGSAILEQLDKVEIVRRMLDCISQCISTRPVPGQKVTSNIKLRSLGSLKFPRLF